MGCAQAVPRRHPDRPRPHRLGGQHAGARLRGRRAAPAAAVLDRAEQCGHGRQQRTRGGGDRTDAGRVDRTGRLGAGDDGAGGAGGLRGPHRARRGSRSFGTRTERKGPDAAGRGTDARGSGRPGRGAHITRSADAVFDRWADRRRKPSQPAFCSSARIRPSASSRLASKSRRVHSWPRGTSLSVRSRNATSGAVPARKSARSRADLKPDVHVGQPLGLRGADVHIPVTAGAVEAVDQQLTAESPGHGGVAGQMEGQPDAYGSHTSYRSSTGIRKESSSETRKLIMTSA